MKYNKQEMETGQVNYKAFMHTHLLQRVSEYWTTGIHLERPIFYDTLISLRVNPDFNEIVTYCVKLIQ
jgi:hypothetical protein